MKMNFKNLMVFSATVVGAIKLYKVVRKNNYLQRTNDMISEKLNSDNQDSHKFVSKNNDNLLIERKYIKLFDRTSDSRKDLEDEFGQVKFDQRKTINGIDEDESIFEECFFLFDDKLATEGMDAKEYSLKK